MPCLPCRSSMMGLIQMAARIGKGPSSDVPVMLHGLGAGGFVPEGFLSPRLCMLCGSVFCPPIADLPTAPEADRGVTIVTGGNGRGGAGTLPSSVGPEDFPGSDEGSHFMAQERIAPPVGRDAWGDPTPKHMRKPLPIRPEWRPNTAMAVLRLLEDRCRATGGALEDAQMDEARQVLAAAVQQWKTIHGEG